MTGVEHYWSQRDKPESKDLYANCFYACRFCNTARGATPIGRGARRLLNPCRAAWADHFTPTDGGELAPKDGNAAAAFTAATYDINDPRRTSLRRKRRRVIPDALRVLEESPALIDHLLTMAASSSPHDRVALVQAAEELNVQRARAVRLLRAYALIPADADQRCSCTVAPRPPDYLGAQAADMSLADPV